MNRAFKTVLLIIITAALASIVNAADLTVSADGPLRSVQAAIDKVPANNPHRFVIAIKAGVYDEQIRVPADKPYITLVGEDAATTRLTFKISNKEAGTTSAAFATYVGGHDFRAENITFENSFGIGSQAVAVLAEADRVVFNKCRFLAWQDTLYAKNGRQYYKDCYIEGSVDFIFGQAAAVFENSTIHSKMDGYIAAPMRFSADEPSGLVFVNCTLTSENTKDGVYLGRPWRDYGRAVFIDTKMDAAIRPEGWNHWLPEREKTAYMAEYRSTGSGAKADARVTWSHQLTADEAKAFQTANFLRGKDGWNTTKSDDRWLEKTAPDWTLVTWHKIFDQKPLWYQTDEAARIADQVVFYQKENGGWQKNIDMAATLTTREKVDLAARRSDVSETTIDNGATYSQVAFLAKMITASLLKPSPPNNFPKYKEAFNKGVDYLLSSQYENGGFPQYFPLKAGYYTHITFNDDAMIGVLDVLRNIARHGDDYKFVDDERRVKAEKAVAKAIPLILRLQIEQNGKKTVWAQQYDEVSLKPAWARKYEPPCLASSESVGIVRFLMGEKPTPEIVAAVEAAVEWFKKNKIVGYRWERKNGENMLVRDAKAPALWARYYEFDTMKPIFLGRDSVVRYSVTEIEPERRNGYAWYGSWPRNVIDATYPDWIVND